MIPRLVGTKSLDILIHSLCRDLTINGGVINAMSIIGAARNNGCLKAEGRADAPIVFRGDRTDKMLEMWSRVKGDNLDSGMVIFILVFFACLIAVGIVRKVKRRRRQYRKRW